MKNNMDDEIKRIEKSEAWDNSDEVVELKVKKPLDKVVPVRLQTEHWVELRKMARELGVGPTTLARMWILALLRSTKLKPEDAVNTFPEKVAETIDSLNITQLEKEILRLVSKGLNNKEIAERTCISENEIKKHLLDISRKLGLRQEYTTINESTGKFGVNR